MSDEMIVAPPEASDLASFETEVSKDPSKPVRWSVEKYKVAQMLALSGKNKRETAKALKLPLAVIDNWLKNPEFTDYMQSLVDDYAKEMKNEGLKYLNKILQARIEQAELVGYADLSRKDTVDIIAEIRKQSGEEMAAEQNYMGLLEKLVNHSVLNQKSVIQIDKGE